MHFCTHPVFEYCVNHSTRWAHSLDRTVHLSSTANLSGCVLGLIDFTCRVMISMHRQGNLVRKTPSKPENGRQRRCALEQVLQPDTERYARTPVIQPDRESPFIRGQQAAWPRHLLLARQACFARAAASAEDQLEGYSWTYHQRHQYQIPLVPQVRLRSDPPPPPLHLYNSIYA